MSNPTIFQLIDDIATLSFSTTGGSPRWIQVRTISGREFKYQLSDYPISSATTPEQARKQAELIIREKYRYCEWDRDHPQVDAECVIFNSLVGLILGIASKIRDAESRRPSIFIFWGIHRDGELIEEYPFRERIEAELRLSQLKRLDTSCYDLRELRREVYPNG